MKSALLAALVLIAATVGCSKGPDVRPDSTSVDSLLASTVSYDQARMDALRIESVRLKFGKLESLEYKACLHRPTTAHCDAVAKRVQEPLGAIN